MDNNNKSSNNTFSNKWTKWTVWGVATLFYVYQYILRVMPNIMLNDIMNRFNMNEGTFGQFTGIYYIGYSLVHIPVGMIFDRFGPKKTMTLCILLNILGMLPLIYSTSQNLSIFGRLLIGIGSSGAALGLFRVIRLMFDENKFSRMLSISVTTGLLGAIYGGAPVNFLCDEIGYQATIKIIIFIGLVLAIISFFLVPNITNKSKSSVFSDIINVLKNKKVMLSCLCAGLLIGPLEGFSDAWGTEFLKKIYNINATYASTICSTIFIGMCFGGPILSFISEKTKSYMKTVIIAGAIMTSVFAMLLLGKISLNIIVAAFFLVGVCCAYQILAIYRISTYVNKNLSGLSTTVANMIMMLFGYAFHTFIGTTTNIMGGIQNYTALSFGISIIPIASAIGVLGFIMIKVFMKNK